MNSQHEQTTFLASTTFWPCMELHVNCKWIQSKQLFKRKSDQMF